MALQALRLGIYPGSPKAGLEAVVSAGWFTGLGAALDVAFVGH